MHNESTRLCPCGCGQPTAVDSRGRARKYATGHYHPPRACPLCGRPPATPHAVYCGAECRRRARAAARRRVAQGMGYVRVYRPGHPLAHKDGYVLEHRYVLHEAGVAIPPGYHVHHVNGVKDDNRLENLEVLPPRRHVEEHVQPGVEVQNQHGTFVVRSPDERRAVNWERSAPRLIAWQQANPERVKARRRARYLENREREIARVKAWKLAQRAKKATQ